MRDLAQRATLPYLQLTINSIRRGQSYNGRNRRLQSKVLDLVSLTVHIIDLTEGDGVVVVLHASEATGDGVMVVPLGSAPVGLA